MDTSTSKPLFPMGSTTIDPNLYINKNLLPMCNYNSGNEHFFLNNDDAWDMASLNIRMVMCAIILGTIVIPVLGLYLTWFSYWSLFPKRNTPQQTQQAQNKRFSIMNLFFYVLTILMNYLWISSIVYIPIYRKRAEEIKRQKRKPCVFQDQVYV